MIPAEKLAPYLPHGLQFYKSGLVWDLYSMSVEGAVLLKRGKLTRVVHEDNVGVEYKPILRVLSHDSMTSEEQTAWQEFEDNFSPDLRVMMDRIYSNLGFLFKHKFDVFGLIAEGLAEDANKITPKI